MINYAQIIKDARCKKLWSQNELARRIEVSIDWVRKVEQGRSTKPQHDILIRAANALDIPISHFYPDANDWEIDEIQYRTREQVDMTNESIRMLKNLSPERLKVATEILIALTLMDDLHQEPEENDG